MKTIKLSTTQNIELEYKVAGLGDRILAYIIDALIFVGLFIIIGIMASLMGDIAESLLETVGVAVIILIVAIYTFYDLLCEIFLNGQSIGKKVMSIKVVRVDGKHPTIGNYLVRWVMRMVDISLTNGLGAVICIAATENGQRIGDIAAGTTVVSTKNPVEFKETIFEEFEAGYTVTYPEVRDLQDKDIHLIKDVLVQSEKVENPDIVFELADKLKSTLGVSTTMAPKQFVKTLLKDYNYLNSDFDEI